MAVLEYIRTKHSSISAHAAWGFGIYAIVQVRFGKPVFIAILAVILAGIAWEIGMEMITSWRAHSRRRYGSEGVEAYLVALKTSHMSRVLSDLKQPEVWRASLPDALTFWIGWVAGLITWG